MMTCGTPPSARRDPAAFLLWGWTMLLVILLSATPTEGVTGTRAMGSAFDPTTASVVLSPKQLRLGASVAIPGKRKVPDVVGPASLVPMMLALVPSPLLQVEAFQSGLLRADASPLLSSRAHAPRAPPAA